MRAAAARGFWVNDYPPFGYRKVFMQDGVKKRPRLEVDKEQASIVRRMFEMAFQGMRYLHITKALNREGIPSPYLLSSLVRCESCRKALAASEAKVSRYAYYVCLSLLIQGRRTCQPPKVNSKHFEGLIVNNILTESNIRSLVKFVDEEMDGEANDQRKRLKTIRKELDEVTLDEGVGMSSAQSGRPQPSNGERPG